MNYFIKYPDLSSNFEFLLKFSQWPVEFPSRYLWPYLLRGLKGLLFPIPWWVFALAKKLEIKELGSRVTCNTQSAIGWILPVILKSIKNQTPGIKKVIIFYIFTTVNIVAKYFKQYLKKNYFLRWFECTNFLQIFR